MTATPRSEEPGSPIVELYGEAMVEELCVTVHHTRCVIGHARLTRIF